MTTRAVSVELNGKAVSAVVEPRLLFSDFIRGEAGLTGTHVGCEHGCAARARSSSTASPSGRA